MAMIDRIGEMENDHLLDSRRLRDEGGDRLTRWRSRQIRNAGPKGDALMRTHVAKSILAATAMLLVAASGAPAATATDAAKPSYSADGTVHVPAFDLPPSQYMSKEAIDLLKRRGNGSYPALTANKDIARERLGMEQMAAPMVQAMRTRYPVDIVEQPIAGVRTRIVTPKGGATDKKRILINLHGGGFRRCAGACALLESIPIAAIGGLEVVTVDYREGPESVFPAASEDVAAVYRELLKSYKPSQVGIYGCSAGGALSGQLAAWLPAHGLPQAGAIGIFGSGATRDVPGDSNYLSAYVDGMFPPPPGAKGAPPPAPYRSYFEGADPNDPMVSPAVSPAVLAKFPPTLIITGTRAPDLSAAAYTHSQLIKAGVPGDLIVGEGLSHCYLMVPQLPESQDAYLAIVKFFRDHLG
jgi:monoterpene epsilon-lactone hydrolase